MSGILKNIRGKLVAGLVTIAPIVITIWVIKALFVFFDEPTSRFLRKVLNFHIPGLGFIITLILLFLLGLLVTNFLGRKLIHWGELILKRIPIANTIYVTAKQITNALTGSSSRAFQKAVLLEYPRRGLWTMAFVTNESKDVEGKDLYYLFVPTTPNPTSGFMLIVPKNETIDANVPVEEALKIIISGGMLAPKQNQIALSKSQLDTSLQSKEPFTE